MSASPPDAWWVRRGPDPATPPPDDGTAGAGVVGGESATVVLDTGPGITSEPGPPPGLLVAPPPSRPRRTGPRALVVAAVAVTAVVLLVIAVAAALAGGGDAPRAAPAAPTVTAVDAAGIRAEASSTQDAQGGVTYDAANTLDGDPATAWNSNGTGRAAGVTLTYTFARPVELRGISVRNGYQKVRARAGRPAVDLYPANERVHRVRVVTDAGTWTWDLADVRAPQAFAGAAGRTASVRFEVVSVYPSTTYADVALSEVSFTAG